MNRGRSRRTKRLQHIYFKHREYMVTLLFVDGKVIIRKSEYNLQKAGCHTYKIIDKFNTKISDSKSKVMVFQGMMP
jgi:hypothetical protein